MPGQQWGAGSSSLAQQQRKCSFHTLSLISVDHSRIEAAVVGSLLQALLQTMQTLRGRLMPSLSVTVLSSAHQRGPHPVLGPTTGDCQPGSRLIYQAQPPLIRLIRQQSWQKCTSLKCG